jgi:hypothetical protein
LVADQSDSCVRHDRTGGVRDRASDATECLLGARKGRRDRHYREQRSEKKCRTTHTQFHFKYLQVEIDPKHRSEIRMHVIPVPPSPHFQAANDLKEFTTILPRGKTHSLDQNDQLFVFVVPSTMMESKNLAPRGNLSRKSLSFARRKPVQNSNLGRGFCLKGSALRDESHVVTCPHFVVALHLANLGGTRWVTIERLRSRMA